MQRELKFGKETRRRRNWDWLPAVLLWVIQILLVCALAFLCVLYFGQRTSNVGDSMNPALKNGDVVLVNRLKYDASAPKRGDIIVFKPNGNESMHSCVKRIVALPGETVQIVDSIIYINGEKFSPEYEVTEIQDPGLAAEEIQLEGDEFFVLGDNRESSEDSRLAEVGNVKRSHIEGEAWFNLTPGDRFGWIR